MPDCSLCRAAGAPPPDDLCPRCRRLADAGDLDALADRCLALMPEAQRRTGLGSAELLARLRRRLAALG